MLSNGRLYMRSSPHIIIFPGIAISLTVLSLNLIGDAIRDALDPRAMAATGR
jgi:peptide/nickel transport system permease protein